ncbi:MAG: ribonuclease H-like domain-containing protein [Candidatus Zixiibacteriota bacterium]
MLKKTFYNSRYVHGQHRLGDLSTVGHIPFSAFTRDEEPGLLTLSSLLFVDTETTGLGGIGTVAFVVGCGSVVEDGFEVRQYVMPDYSDEAALLEALLNEFRHDRVIISYNGTAFDLPVLRGRMIVNRVQREIPMKGHIDLLYPTRRLFRRRLGDCSLPNIERELFDFHRDNDIPGHLIPSIYFNWLSEQESDGMIAVLEHNRMDIVTLFFLAGYISRAFVSEGGILHDVDDLHSLSRIYGWRKDNDRITNLYRRIETVNCQSLADDVLLFHAQAFKRTGAFDKAVAIWERISESASKEGFWANVELAKFYEHRAKDIEKAYRYAIKANSIVTLSKRERRRMEKRLSRLSSKRNG